MKRKKLCPLEVKAHGEVLPHPCSGADAALPPTPSTDLTPNEAEEIRTGSTPTAEVWSVQRDEVAVCGWVRGEAALMLSALALGQIRALLAAYPSTEWFTYLRGERTLLEGRIHGVAEEEDSGDDTNRREGYSIRELFVPQQIVTPGSAAVNPGQRLPQDVIGCLHSHHAMGAFCSQTDHDHQNWAVYVVVSAQGQDKGGLGFSYVAHVVQQLPCGSFYQRSARLLTEASAPDAQWLQAARARVHEHVADPSAVGAPHQLALPGTENPIWGWGGDPPSWYERYFTGMAEDQELRQRARVLLTEDTEDRAGNEESVSFFGTLRDLFFDLVNLKGEMEASSDAESRDAYIEHHTQMSDALDSVIEQVQDLLLVIRP